MSRVVDALKRARRAQRNPPRAPAPLPATPTQHAQPRPHDFSLTLLLALACVLLFAGGLISFVLFRHIPVQTTTTVNALSAPATPDKPAPAAPAAPTALPVVSSANVPTLHPLRPPASTLPVLQGVFYRPDRPSAVINGKTVQPGSMVGDFQVLAITFDSVTIGNATQTNVLRLSE